MGEPPPKRVRRSRAPSSFRQRDLAVAIKAAKGSGLAITRIDIEPAVPRFQLVMKNGTAETEAATNPFDTAPLPQPPARRTRKTK
jgi:hypothetical protein